MAIRKRKPTSPGHRFQTVSDFSEITRSKPERSLVVKQTSTGGRNNYGRRTARHRGGGHKQRYRLIDFTRRKDGVPATVASVEYDPNRTCRIALLHYHDGEKRYILAPRGVEVGDVLHSGRGSEVRPGKRHGVAPHSGGNGDPQRGVAPRRRWPTRAQRRRERATCGQGGPFRHVAPTQHRNAQGADRLPRNRGGGRQLRARTREDRQGGKKSLEGCQATNPWRGDAWPWMNWPSCGNTLTGRSRYPCLVPTC